MMPPVASRTAETRRWTLIAVCVTTFMLLLDITIVNVALPSIQRRLTADLTGLQWVVDAYALALAALILTAAVRSPAGFAGHDDFERVEHLSRAEESRRPSSRHRRRNERAAAPESNP
jgi:hypothetical protein